MKVPNAWHRSVLARLGPLVRLVTLALPLSLALGAAGCDCGGPVDPMKMMGSDTGTDAASDGGGSDAAPPPDGGDASVPGPVCGDGVIEMPEECDDGNTDDNDECNAECIISCGDGDVDMSEVCDVGIPAGLFGSCPDLAACDDSDACTIDRLSGSTCGATCTNTPSVSMSGGSIVGSFVDGDGCCASIANANVDSDCSAQCGNGVLEPGETCEPSTGCPSGCDDGNACTTDITVGSGATCDLACSAVPLTACAGGDGCCPAGCCSASTPGCTNSDSDCSSSCGDGILDPGETCDPPGTCVADCDDADACTVDTMTGDSSTCSTACSHTPVSGLMDGDGCCPVGADATSDSDCAAQCGNGIVEPGEECDDGNSDPSDGCDAVCVIETVVFRLTSLAIREPHIYVDIPLLGCTDVTDMIPGNLAPAPNESILDAMSSDWDLDGYLDVNILLFFRPLDQTAAVGTNAIGQGLCTHPASSTVCTLDLGNPPMPTLYQNINTGICMDTFFGTTTPLPGGYMPPVMATPAPCFVTGPVPVVLDLQVLMAPLIEAQASGTYIGAPAAMLSNGLIRGFLTEQAADAIILPTTIPFVGGMPLSLVLPGAPGNCAMHDDQDIGPDGMTLGWWLYGNYEAETVPYTGPTP